MGFNAARVVWKAGNHAMHRSAACDVYKLKTHWPHSVIAAVIRLKQMEDLLNNLEPIRKTGFCARYDSARILGHPVLIEIETRSVPSDTPIPKLNDQESTLVALIVENIDHCINESLAKLQGDESYQRLNEANAQIARPHVWISREMMLVKGMQRWTMVVGVDVNPDFGWHVEFDGLECLELWAGD